MSLVVGETVVDSAESAVGLIGVAAEASVKSIEFVAVLVALVIVVETATVEVVALVVVVVVVVIAAAAEVVVVAMIVSVLAAAGVAVIVFPDEYKHWKGEELYNFYIEPYSVDRVYFCESAWIILSEFRMLLKIQYKSRPLYVELLYTEDENEIKVMILTYRIQRFIDSIVSDYGERENILKFMLDDDSNIQRSWDTDSSLKHLCCKTIYSYRYKCWGAFIDKIIPRIMWNKINDNIEMQKIKDTYERKICMISMVKKQPDLYPW